MKPCFKKSIYIVMCILGVLIFLGLYILVSLVTEDEFPNLRYVVMGLGYISIGLFCSGFLLLMFMNKKVEEEKSVKR